MGLILTLLAVAVVVGVIGWVRAHPKPAGEPLETYIEDTAKGVVAEAKADAEADGAAVLGEVKKVTHK